MADEQETKPMRHGYTTGSCATAASKAALWALIHQRPLEEVTIRIPAGEDVTFRLVQCEVERGRATCGVIKDGGDDPDATHGALILSEVSWTEEPGIVLDGGVGVGRVTKPGLPVPVGEAAINPVPRKMITGAIRELLAEHEPESGVKVVVSVPDGEEIAKKTLNGRLGIIGGISILGTRGTVVPFSTAAFRASIAQAIRVARANGCGHLVASTGGKSEKFGMQIYPQLQEEAFIEMGDFVGFTIKQCKHAGVSKVTLIGMMGKFSKVAQGVMMVHSKGSSVDFPFLAKVAAEAGASDETVREIVNANTAAQVGTIMGDSAGFFRKLCEYCCREALREAGGGLEMETMIINMNGELLGRAALHG
ncbi:cobalt-precorrin-6A synthase [Gordoniibacillus kamchatkensis]|uniref:Cobalt-precorrin-5B C(1)-methyltransferase n=1 Tax=Gordoniibacillus kamchatkensis TaxID=1590651 RepID=A0ABR5ADI5_9BACL|nr:cobalt-precorrin-5B (C(1))-methyltransferase [Paenibacillus sp. VKM B-2647]KIL38650.1 cobalt-precorrin-6A synthase [Paenibacillus sp. VKM B-2647]